MMNMLKLGLVAACITCWGATLRIASLSAEGDCRWASNYAFMKSVAPVVNNESLLLNLDIYAENRIF